MRFYTVILAAAILSPVTLLAQDTQAPSRPFGPRGRSPYVPPTAANLPAAVPNNTATLPATAPTALPVAQAATQPAAAITPKIPHHRASVTYTNGILDVRADNSSLNQILREISRQTGMTITGGVAEQRVFGNYGPADPSTVLATLLDGTGVNMLLSEGSPAELVLTQRTGGPTPPNPNAPGFDGSSGDDDPPQQAQQPAPAAPAQPFQQQAPQPAQTIQQAQQPATTTSGPQPVAQPSNNPLGNPANTTPTASTLPTATSVPLDAINTPSTVTAPAQGIVDSANPPPANATSSQNSGPTSDPSVTPAGPATPDDIYQQLLRLQQQNKSPATTNAPVKTPQ